MNRFEFLQTVFKIEFLVLFYTSNDRFHQVYFKKLLSCRPISSIFRFYSYKLSRNYHNSWTELNFYKRFSKLNSSCFLIPGMIDFIKFTIWNYHFVALFRSYGQKKGQQFIKQGQNYHNSWTGLNFYKRCSKLNSSCFLNQEWSISSSLL